MEKAELDDKSKESVYTQIIKNLNESFGSHDHETPHDVYAEIIGELSTIPYASWTGIYMVTGHELILNSYKGEKTQYDRIQIGRGICGSALAEVTDKIIEDVTKETNYLIRSIDTRSEIAVLIIYDEHVIGLIDIESEILGAFSEQDQHYLHQINNILIQQLRALGPQ